MDLGWQVFTYIAVSVLAIALSFGLLAITRIPVVVVLFAAALTAVLHQVYARIMGAHWDTIALITFITVLVYASVISFAFLGIGHFFRWSTFVDEKQN
jgi:hypothetical protein